jgi:lipopolysaccharide/colanic/teichoic acid biosynthesis glycosyltransferase
MIRFFDILFSIIGLLIFSPLFIAISLWIKLDSQGPILFRQHRVGKDGADFIILKFRSMIVKSDPGKALTIGNNDPRLTRAGYFLRKYKLDELPQLINVLIGDMSLVGPRPEVPKYVAFYTEEQRKVLNIRPGITDYASIRFIDENEVLARAENPEEYYIQIIMPKKLKINSEFIDHRNLLTYFKIIFKTIGKIFHSANPLKY